MKGPTISGTSGYTYSSGQQPDIKTRQVLVGAGVTVAAGNCVGWSAAANDGISVIIATAAVPPCGVALEAGTAGDYIQIQTHGLNQVPMVSDGTVVAGDVICSIAAGAVLGVTVANLAATLTGAVVGYALVTDAGTVVAAGDVFIKPFMG